MAVTKRYFENYVNNTNQCIAFMKNCVKSLISFRDIFFLLMCIGFLSELNAKHIIGGDVFYECLEIDTIDNQVQLHFEFQMYRDNRCITRGEECAFFDGDPRDPNMTRGAQFGVYRFDGLNWRFVQVTGFVTPISIEKVPPNEPPCLIAPPAADVERGVYEFDLTLDIIDKNYMIAYQRCCRSESITNLVNPGSFGAVFSVEITPEAIKTCNNSPVFNEFPPLVVCAGFELEYDHGASDVEGDQVVYEFCTPLSSGGTNGRAERSSCNETPVPEPSACTPDGFRFVRFLSPTFISTAPMGGNPVVSIDANNGMLAGVPEIVGEHVLAVCANEYRDGVLLSTIRRDFQFIVSACEKAVNAEIASDQSDGMNFDVISCGDFDVQFENLSTRERDIIQYQWEFDFGDETLTSLSRDPLITFPDLGTYDAKMILNPGIPNCTDSAFITIEIFPGLNSEFNFRYDTCEAGPVTFIDLSTTEDDNFITDWTWNYNDGNSRNGLNRNPLHTYEVPGTFDVSLTIIDNNGCTDELVQELIYAPAPNLIIVEPSQFIGCEPAEVFFNNLTFPIDDTYDITWDFGDGSNDDNIFDISPKHIYQQDGIYSVSVDIVSPLGCLATRSFPNWINVQRSPDADFSISPNAELISINNNTVSFLNQTIGAIEYYWDFGDGNFSFTESPTHAFQDTGVYDVLLLATSSNGCTDTIIRKVDVVPIASMQFPNAFTPNGDGKNDLFRGKGSTSLINNFEMVIYDRWGKIVYSSNEPTAGWNGKLNNIGANLPPGVYMFSAKWREPRGDEDSAEGAATLIR